MNYAVSRIEDTVRKEELNVKFATLPSLNLDHITSSIEHSSKTLESGLAVRFGVAEPQCAYLTLAIPFGLLAAEEV